MGKDAWQAQFGVDIKTEIARYNECHAMGGAKMKAM
jgi:hypothetical protein